MSQKLHYTKLYWHNGAFQWIVDSITVDTSISKMHVALDFIGRNSAYSVTLNRRDISQLIPTHLITYASVKTTIIKESQAVFTPSCVQ